MAIRCCDFISRTKVKLPLSAVLLIISIPLGFLSSCVGPSVSNHATIPIIETGRVRKATGTLADGGNQATASSAPPPRIHYPHAVAHHAEAPTAVPYGVGGGGGGAGTNDTTPQTSNSGGEKTRRLGGPLVRLGGPLLAPSPAASKTEEKGGGTYKPLYVGSGAIQIPETQPSGIKQNDSTSDTLPEFFPPTATSTEDLDRLLEFICKSFKAAQEKGPTIGQLDRLLSSVLEDAKYDHVSHYWLRGQDNPGFALATHIEFIDDLGRPIMNHRFETRLPTADWFNGLDFWKALVLPRNGRYRLIALVVAQNPLEEKSGEMTTEQVKEINHGPNGLSGRDWVNLEVTPEYHFTPYVYEFYRKYRSQPVTVNPESNLPAASHLASINFVHNVDTRMESLAPQP